MDQAFDRQNFVAASGGGKEHMLENNRSIRSGTGMAVNSALKKSGLLR